MDIKKELLLKQNMFVEHLNVYRFSGLEKVEPFEIMESDKDANEINYQMPDEIKGKKLHINDTISGRDKYYWIEKKLKLPPKAEGMQVVGLFDFGVTNEGYVSGFESLLFVNGEPYQGVDENHKDVVLDKYAGQEVTLTFLMWTGLSIPGNGFAFNENVVHTVKDAQIGYIDTKIDDLYYHLKAVIETIEHLPDTSVEKSDLFALLQKTYGFIHHEPDRIIESAYKAYDYLTGELKKMDKLSPITVNAVGHTHIDVAWLWRLKHSHEKATRSFSTVLRLMDEFDEFVFLQSQPQLYKYIKQDAPDIFEKIKQKVTEGKWEADGGMWVEADCNLISGESFVRQFVHGINFFKKEFGKSASYLWLPDVFGYSWALPQILKLCNIKTFMTIKVSWNPNPIPHDVFTWRGIDGSEVLACFMPNPPEPGFVDMTHIEQSRTYNGLMEPREMLGSWEIFKDKDISKETLFSFGYGDGGGGVNRKMLKMRRIMDKMPGLPNVKTTTAGEYFDRVHEYAADKKEILHTWDGELYFEYHRGTYTSQAYNKKQNRKMEYKIADAEWLSSIGYLMGMEYEQKKINDMWEIILTEQFHDIIPGSSIKEVYEDSHVNYDYVDKSLGEVIDEKISNISADKKDTYFVCNSGSFDRKDIVEISCGKKGIFYDENNNELKSQWLGDSSLVAMDINKFSINQIHFEKKSDIKSNSSINADVENQSINTPFYDIKWDNDGNISYLYDKEFDRNVVLEGNTANELRIYEDKTYCFDAWEIDYSHMFKWEKVEMKSKPKVIENGELRTVIQFEYSYHNSKIVQNMILYSGSRRIDFVTGVDWNERHRLLKVNFPVDIRNTKATYDIQFGHVERPTHYNTSWDKEKFEVAHHKWMDYSESNYGVSILNDCKYGGSVFENNMSLTLLKSSESPDPTADIGHHEFTYSLLPHSGDVVNGNTIYEAENLNIGLKGYRGICKAANKQIVKTNTECVRIDAIKKAEDEECIIVRLHECVGGRHKLELSSDYDLKEYAECNLLEENIGTVKEGSVISSDVNPFEIKTYKLYF